MSFKQCNIDQTDRINRTVIGVILVLAALINLGRGFYMLVGVILIVEGLIGWCSIPYVTEKVKTWIHQLKNRSKGN